MTVYVVRYDHPDYSQGIEGVYLSRDGARESIRQAFDIESFDYATDVEESETDVDGTTVFEGRGNADGIYYVLSVETVQP